MINKSLKDVQKLSNGKGLLNKFDNIMINGVSTDTRAIKGGELFVPLMGENFDAHNFIEKAIENGACASLWQENIPLPQIDFPFILVEDTLSSLQTLAKNYRSSLDVKVIGITGSNGKTTTKDIMEGVLSRKYKTKKTMGNLNNHIGVPLTLLSLDKETEVAIVEMGTDGFGQIDLLTRLAQPDVTIITNIGDSHLEDLGSKENVARAKFEILKGMDSNGIFIYGGDDPILNKIIKEFEIPGEKLSFGEDIKNFLHLNLTKETNDCIEFMANEHVFKLPMIGKHNMLNAGVAILVARIFSIDDKAIQDGFYHIQKTGMRNELIEKDNFTILNDAYKSNPNSLSAALNTLYSLKGYHKKIVVLGDMLGLGEDDKKLHKNAGKNIDASKVDLVFTYGELSKELASGAKLNFDEQNVFSFTDKELLSNELKKHIEDKTIILVKASRYMKLEDVINNLLK